MRPQFEIHGKNHLPKSGCLIIPGRLNHQELLFLEKELSHRPITWLCEENVALDQASRDYLERDDTTALAFSATDSAPESIGENLKTKLDNEGVIIFLPGEASTRAGECSHIPAPVIKQLCALHLPVTPLSVTRPHETAIATENTHKLADASLTFGALIAAGDVSIATWREHLLAAEEKAFSSRKFLNGSLTMALLRGLKKHGASATFFDGSDDSSTSYAKILGAALALSTEIKKQTQKKRVGILLPPGKGGMIANLAVLFAGKIPVNLNFTSSHDAITSSIRQADLDKFITADAFMRKMSSFPWPPNRDIIFIERILPSIKKKIIRWVILAKILPATLIAKIIGIGNLKGDDEAILLFTSGSSGEPKGVPLTHRNVLANVCQFGSRIDLDQDSKILGCLPLFHSFGCTVTLWYPCIAGISLVTYTTPLETKRLAELIQIHSVNMLLSTPTFLRGYMRRVEPEQLKSLEYVVTGAEKLPESLASAFGEKFGITPMEGYGLTETSPATNVNLPDPPRISNHNIISSNRYGSVGKLLPGIAIKITDPLTDKPLNLDTSGIIWLRAANVFPGYLNNESKTKEVIHDGWFNTGDIGKLDDDGFLFIEGRLSRFSKIGGEMVPHETLEAAITDVLGLDSETERKIAIVGVPCDKKGETIALLSTICGDTHEQECIDLRYKLMDKGIPSLWCPKVFIATEKIPILASGKLDIRGCQQLAEHHACENFSA